MIPFVLMYASVAFGTVGISLTIRGEYHIAGPLFLVALVAIAARAALDRSRGDI